jgi:hypothetical protein
VRLWGTASLCPSHPPVVEKHGLADCFDFGAEAGLGAGDGVSVNDLLGTGLIQSLGGQPELNLSLFGIAGRNGLPYLSALASHRPFDREVSLSVGDVLS